MVKEKNGDDIKKNNVGKIYDSYNKGNKKYYSSQNLPIIENFNLNKTFTEEKNKNK